MEFVEGESLESLIKRSGRLEAKPALEIATQVATGLAAVHKQGLVHRDVEPSNVMVSFEEKGARTAKIIDLGLAKAINEPLSASRNFEARNFCRDSRVCQSRAIHWADRGHPVRSLLAWRGVLGNGDRARYVHGFRR